VARRNPQVVAGWSNDMTPVMDASLICAVTCRTTVTWRLGITELGVFGLRQGGLTLVGTTGSYR